MEIRNLGSDLISIMIITVTILATITTLGSLTRAREQEARPACGSASSACTPVKLLCDLGGGIIILAVVNEVDVDGDRLARLVVKLPWKPPWKERTESCGVPGVSFVCNIFVCLEIMNRRDP